MTTTQSLHRAQLVAELAETEQVHRLLFDYALHLDMNHPDEIAALFTEDCYVAYGPDFGAEGRAAYRETLGGIGSFFAATSHHVSNIVVDFGPDLTDGDRAVLALRLAPVHARTAPTATSSASTTTSWSARATAGGSRAASCAPPASWTSTSRSRSRSAARSPRDRRRGARRRPTTRTSASSTADRSPGSSSTARTRPTRCRTPCSTSSPTLSRGSARRRADRWSGSAGRARGSAPGYDIGQVGVPEGRRPGRRSGAPRPQRQPLPRDLGPPQAGDRRRPRLLRRRRHPDVRVRRPDDRRRRRPHRRAGAAARRGLHRPALGADRRPEAGQGAGVAPRQHDRRHHRGRVGLGQPRRRRRRGRPHGRGDGRADGPDPVRTSCGSRSCR